MPKAHELIIVDLKERIAQLETSIAEQSLKLNESQALSITGSWEWNVITGEVTWSDMMYQILGIKTKSEEPSYDLALKYVHPEDKETYVIKLQQSLENGENYHFKNRIQRDDGVVLSVVSKGKCFFNSKDEVVKMIGTVQDVSIKEKYLQENKELKQFVYIASHDLKSPLQTISNYCNLLSRKYKDQLDENANIFLAFIQAAVKRMQTQIDDLLEYSQLGTGRSRIEIDCNEILKEVQLNLNYSIEESNCSFDIGDLPIIQGHKTEIVLLFQNLISNAIKYKSLEKSPHIVIKCVKEIGMWKFSIIDNGIGIENKYLLRIFTIFERLHYAEEYEGTGIGLAHCRKIVSLHGGEIWATSYDMEGSSFHFTLRA